MEPRDGCVWTENERKLAELRGRLLKIDPFSVHLGITELHCVFFLRSIFPFLLLALRVEVAPGLLA